MFINAHYRRLFCPLLIVIGSLILASACSAVSMDVSIGFDGAVKSWSWAPVTVKLTNSGSDSMDGILRIDQPDTSRSDMPQCSAIVNLPANSTKLYTIYTKVSDYGTKMIVTLISRSGDIQKTVNINPLSKDETLVVSVGDQMSRLNFLSGEIMPPNSARRICCASNSSNNSSYYSSYGGASGGASSPSPLRIGSIMPDSLPDRPAAYSAVDVLVVSDLSSSQVNPKALKAISMWVASGGMLVVSANANYKNYINDFYNELLPVTITGSTSVAGLTSVAKMGATPFAGSAISVAQCQVKPEVDAKVLASEGGLPIVVERNYGEGKVIFLAVDHLSPAFRNWNGQVKFWKNLVATPVWTRIVEPAGRDDSFSHYYYPGSSRSYQMSVDANSLAGTAAPNPSVTGPSYNTIGIFLLAYIICLVPVNYFLLRKKRKLEMAWVTSPAIVVLFTLGAYGIGSTMKSGGLQLYEVQFIETSSECRYASMITGASLFSPARRSYSVEISDPYSVSEISRSDKNERFPDFYAGEKTVVDGVGMAMWSSKFFESQSGTDIGGVVKSDLALSGNKVTGRVRNNLPVRLDNCFIVYGNAVQSIGDLNPGAETEVDIIFKPSATGQYAPPYQVQNDVPVEQRIQSFAMNKAKSSVTPILLASSSANGSIYNTTNASPTVKSLRYYAVRLNYRAGGMFSIQGDRIPRSAVQTENMDVQNQDAGTGAFNLAMRPGGSATIQYHIPIPSSAQITSLAVRVGQAGKSMSSLQFSAYNCATGNYDLININPGNAVINPALYMTPGGDVRIKAQCKSATSRSMWVTISAQGQPR